MGLPSGFKLLGLDARDSAFAKHRPMHRLQENTCAPNTMVVIQSLRRPD